MRARRDLGRPRPLPGGAGDLRGRAGVGALLPDRVRRGAVGCRCGRRAATHGLLAARLPRDRRPAAREGLPGVGRRHHARGHAVRGRARLRGQAGQGRRLHRPRGAAARPRGARRRAGCAAWRWPTRGGHARLGAGAARRRGRGRVTSGGLRVRRRPLDRLRLPAGRGRRGRGTAVEVEVFGEWVAAEVAAEPRGTRDGARIRA